MPSWFGGCEWSRPVPVVRVDFIGSGASCRAVPKARERAGGPRHGRSGEVLGREDDEVGGPAPDVVDEGEEESVVLGGRVLG